MACFHIQPSDKLRKLVELHGGTNQAAEKWEIEYRTLRRFLDEGLGISSRAVATIIEKTGMPYNDLFVHIRKEECTS